VRGEEGVGVGGGVVGGRGDGGPGLGQEAGDPGDDAGAVGAAEGEHVLPFGRHQDLASCVRNQSWVNWVSAPSRAVSCLTIRSSSLPPTNGTSTVTVPS